MRALIQGLRNCIKRIKEKTSGIKIKTPDIRMDKDILAFFILYERQM